MRWKREAVFDNDDAVVASLHPPTLSPTPTPYPLPQYDTVHRTWDKTVIVDGSDIVIDGVRVTFTQQPLPESIPMSKDIEMVCDCTGKFLKVAKLNAAYLENDSYGIKKVVVSAPVKEAGALNVVLGCNHEKLSGDIDIITNASCTTNCIGPVVRVIKETFGIKHGCITTCHNVTGTQTLVDMPNTKKVMLERPQHRNIQLVTSLLAYA